MENYKIICAHTIQELVIEVNYQIQSFHYQVIGGAFFDGTNYCQAIVKY